ncbi:hypothetical protein [Streptomyces achromogenes]|uniref:hypothetical protein n=1 Tax=Streptomyces achromogenes TaxID=67255 RepID=UPI0036FAA68F
MNGQVAGTGQRVVPGAPRDFPHILDTLLDLLGCNFSPRFKDLADQRSTGRTCCAWPDPW